jgi:hypothetical protein
MAPGGGGTGMTTVPSYVSQYHSLWMGDVPVNVNAAGEADGADTDAPLIEAKVNGFNLADELNTAKLLNPFTGVSAFNPDAILGEIDDVCQDFLDLIADLDPEDQLNAAITLATTQADTIFNTNTQIDAAVNAFDLRGQEAFQRSVSRAAAGLLGSRSVMTGMFDNTIAYMENQRQMEVNDYDAKIRLTYQDQRINYIQTTAQSMLALVQQQLSAYQTAVELKMRTGIAHITGKNDQITADTALDKNEVLWTLDMFPTYVAGMISSYTGGVPSSREQSLGDKALATLFGVAQLGIGVASIFKK